MNNTIHFTHSAWFLLLAIVIAGGAVYFLYWKSIKEKDCLKYRCSILSCLRFFSVLTVIFLLLGPFLKTRILKTQKPIVIIAQDHSTSLLLTKDSAYNKEILPMAISELAGKLSSKYDVKSFRFGGEVDSMDWKFTEKETNFESLFSFLSNRYFDQNIGALVIASDGIVNQGIAPVSAAQKVSYPIYCIALGDTNSLKDISIREIDCNRIAYYGNTFPLFVNISATDYYGETATIELFENNSLVSSQNIDVDSKQFFKKIEFKIKADSLGINEYQVLVKPAAIEENTINNTKKIYVEVTKDEKKILLLYEGYHPDIAVFQNILGTNQAFSLTKKMVSQFNDSIQKFDLVILHQLPSKTNNLQNIFNGIIEFRIPYLFILGDRTSIAALNNLKTFLQISQNKVLNTETYPVYNSSFALFQTSFDTDLLKEFPPLLIPFGNYPEVSIYHSILNQQVGQVTTNKPLWFFADAGELRSGFILGEGIWKWRLIEYSKYSNHDITNELVLKTVHYLTSENKKEPLVVEFPTIVVQEKPVYVNAKLYNQSFEMVNDPELFFEIIDQNGNVFPFLFQKTAFSYALTIENLPIGTYRYVAKTKLGETAIQKEGKFIVQESQIEKNSLIANHQLLYQLATDHNGKLYDKEKIDELADELLTNKTIVPTIFEKKGYDELMNFKVLFILLIITISSEWFLRKYWGNI